MAFYIELIKDSEEDKCVYYSYQYSTPSESYLNKAGKKRFKLKTVSGKLQIDKKTGDIHTLELAEGDNGSYVLRAGWALRKHWQNGEFPDKTCWAS
jgi:hypothetical protein